MTMGKFRFLLQCMPALRSGFSDFSTFDLIAATYWTDLDQRHLRAKSEQNFLRFGGVGVVSVLVEPLLQRPRHVLKSLTFVSHFPPTGMTPIERNNIIRKTTQRGQLLYRDYFNLVCCNRICSLRVQMASLFLAGVAMSLI